MPRPIEVPVKVLGLVQARMSSTRLPGKVMMKIGPMTALEWAVTRLKLSKTVDEVMVATTLNRADRPIVEMCRNHGWPVHCGSEQDVLSRMIEAATVFSPRIIVDVTSDCPFVDLRHIDALVNSIVRHGVDYASNIEPRSWPDGLDVQVYKMASLLRLGESEWAIREHSGWNFTKAPWRQFMKQKLEAPPRWHRPTWRLTLDTAADLVVLRECWDRYIKQYINQQPTKDGYDFPVGGLLDFLLKHEEILSNSNVKSTTPGVKK